MPTSSDNCVTIQNKDITQALSEGRMLLGGQRLCRECEDSLQQQRTEWNKGSVVHTIYNNIDSDNEAERMINLLKIIK